MRQGFSSRSARVTAILAVAASAMPLAGPARAETTPPQPAAAQPSLPKDMPALATPSVPPKTLEVHRRASRHHVARRHVARIHQEPLERPALGSVVLSAPLPRPVEPPHVLVPVPAYPLEAAVAAYTTPLPPVVCHRVRRDPAAPDPHLLGETPVFCEPDTP